MSFSSFSMVISVLAVTGVSGACQPRDNNVAAPPSGRSFELQGMAKQVSVEKMYLRSQ
jgi:hypothetical protein